MSRPRLAVLISGTGRNLQAILEACRDGRIAAEPALVISNRADAAGLAYAASHGVPTGVLDHRTFAARAGFDTALAEALDDAGADLVALAGFMRILTPGFVSRYGGRLFNIHPSLLPKYPGLDTHARALAAGEREHGASVHYVTNELDGGPVVLQGRVEVRTGESAEQLAERVMQAIEIRIYPRVLAWAAAGRLQLQSGRIVLDGRVLDAPRQLEDLHEN